MPRSQPSRADRELIDIVSRTAGVQVSAAQLERWRQSGLLPRVSRRMEGRYGSTCQLPQGSVEMAAALGRHARRGRGTADLAILTWLDGAPVNRRLLAKAAVQVFGDLLELLTRTLAQVVVDYGPPEDLRGEDPRFDQAEALSLWLADKMGSRMRKMKARLAAAGYGSDSLALANIFVVMAIQSEDLPEEETDRILVALGIKEPMEADGRPNEDGLAVALGWATRQGLQAVMGQSASDWLTTDIRALNVGEVTGEELELARQDLAAYLAMMMQMINASTDDMGRATDSVGTARAVAAACLLWARLRGQLPAGLGLKDLLERGLRAAQQLQPA
jgi:hypothetical protein